MRQNTYEMFLDRLDPAWRGDQLAFFRVLAEQGPEGVAELAERLCLASCSHDLKRLGLEASYYFAWPEWIPVLGRLLRYEKDPATFETGARALGRLGSAQAIGALKELYQFRGTQPFHGILEQVLNESDPEEAFRHHLARLLEGSARASEANEGAHQLEKLLTPEALEALKPLAAHPDVLVYRHGLRLLCQIPSVDAAEFLLQLLAEAHADALAERELRATLNAFRSLPRPEVRERAAQVLAQRWEERDPTLAVDLGSQAAEAVVRALRVIRDAAPGPLETFLADAVEAALDEKTAQLSRLLTQAGDQAAQRTRRLEFALDTTAAGLAALAQQGHLPIERLVEPLATCLREGTGKAGVASALAEVVPATDQACLDLLLGDSDGALRMAALEALGARRDPELGPCLARLRKDPISDLAQRALWHLGQLPGAEDLGRSWLDEGTQDEVLAGLRFALMHRLVALAPEILKLVEAEPQETVLFAALQTLGGLGAMEAVEPLLERLHSGQPPKLQVALAESLRDFGHHDVAVALGLRALDLASPEVCTVGIEALARAHDSEGIPLPAGDAPLLLKLIQPPWEARNPWPLRRRVAGALLALEHPHPDTWQAISTRFQQTLGEKRNPGAVASDDLAFLNTCARILALRAQA